MDRGTFTQADHSWDMNWAMSWQNVNLFYLQQTLFPTGQACRGKVALLGPEIQIRKAQVGVT